MGLNRNRNQRIFANVGDVFGLLEVGLWLLTTLIGPFVWMYRLAVEAKFTTLGIVLTSWLISAAFVLFAVRRGRFYFVVLGLCVGWLVAVLVALGFQ